MRRVAWQTSWPDYVGHTCRSQLAVPTIATLHVIYLPGRLLPRPGNHWQRGLGQSVTVDYETGVSGRRALRDLELVGL